MSTIEKPWCLMITGLPPSPTFRHDDFGQKRPYAFVSHLLETAAHVHADSLREDHGELVQSDHKSQMVRRAAGSPETHYCAIETVNLEVEPLMFEVELKTFGLPGIELEWNLLFENEARGQGIFRRQGLRVCFEDEIEKTRFTRIWKDFFWRQPYMCPCESSSLSLGQELVALHQSIIH